MPLQQTAPQSDFIIIEKICDALSPIGEGHLVNQADIAIFLFIFKYLSDSRNQHIEELRAAGITDENLLNELTKGERVFLPEMDFSTRTGVNKRATGDFEILTNEFCLDLNTFASNLANLIALFHDSAQTTFSTDKVTQSSRIGFFKILSYSDNGVSFLTSFKVAICRAVGLTAQLSFPPVTGESSEYQAGQLFNFLLHVLQTKHKQNIQGQHKEEIFELFSELLLCHEVNLLSDPHCYDASLLFGVHRKLVSSKNKLKLLGTEKSSSHYYYAELTRRLHSEVKNVRLENVDSLRKELSIPFNADAAISMAPLLSRNEDIDSELDENLIEDRNMTCTLLNSLESKVTDDGVIVSLVPQGYLYREGTEMKHRKESVLKDNIVDAVINLPLDFLEGIIGSYSLVIFKKERSKNGILLIDLSTHFQKLQNIKLSNNEVVAQAVAKYQRHCGLNANIPGSSSCSELDCSVIVTHEQFVDANYSLHPTHFLDVVSSKNPSENFSQLHDKSEELRKSIFQLGDEISIQTRELYQTLK